MSDHYMHQLRKKWQAQEQYEKNIGNIIKEIQSKYEPLPLEIFNGEVVMQEMEKEDKPRAHL